ncbi:hypothetical protein LCGC14_2375200 [marine sediment metagenome]|uniref:Uncharacterized protein n=1 Tax=marine sediment metagenome TaxID=412755 RepID=A0A0F9C2K8_9ZZZZ
MEQANQARVVELEEKIVQARADYYNAEASVADEVYDAWVDDLAELKEQIQRSLMVQQVKKKFLDHMMLRQKR